MAARDEAELLRGGLNPESQQLKKRSPAEISADRHVEELRLAFENQNGEGRRSFAAKACKLWSSLPLGLQNEYVRLISGIWNYYLLEGRLDRVKRESGRLIRLGRRTGRTPLEAEGLLADGIRQLVLGNPNKAVRSFELSRALFSATECNSMDVIRVEILLADSYRLDGDRSSALALLQRARKSCLQLEDLPLLCSVSLTLGILYSERGLLREAKNCFGFVIGSASLLSSEKRLLRGRLGLSKTLLRCGESEEGGNLARSALREAQSLDLRREIALAHEYLSDSYSQHREWDQALQCLAKVNKYSASLSASSDIRLELHRKLAEYWIRRGDQRYARIHVKRGLASAGSRTGEDVHALRRLEIEAEWMSQKGEWVFEALSQHAEEMRRLGFGYEHFLTACSILNIAKSTDRNDIVSEWRPRVEYLSEAGGIDNWLSFFEDKRDHNSDDDVSMSPLASELPIIELDRYGIITESKKIQEQAKWVAKVAKTNVPILILGESGTGKELFANLVHSLSERREQVYLAVNCAALPTELLESELFGHKRGAFTGAISDKEGLLLAAHRGTVFLDEVGEMGVAAQAKLLRVLEIGEFRRIGSTRTENVDVRVVAATNRDLQKAVREGAFRQDLYYRLRGLEVCLPPLRDRLSDIPLLANHFLRIANKSMDKTLELSFYTKQWLMGLPWLGNVRELKLAIERAVAIASDSGPLHPYHFVNLEASLARKSLPKELEEIERARVEHALGASEWNVTLAAKLLGLSRTTLSSRIKRLGITRPKD